MSTAHEIPTLVDRLCTLSRNAFANPHVTLTWPDALPDDALCFSPELSSLYGTPIWDTLSEEQRRKLAFHETVNFFSLNIHGEKALIEGLARRLYSRENPELSPYIHHFLDEENKHMLYFGTFCQKYFGRTYPDKKLAVPAERSGVEEDFLFFLKVLIFEETVDTYNVAMGKDDRLLPVVRAINEMHHADESRHLAFGRLLVKKLHGDLVPSWTAEKRAEVSAYAADYLRATWREYYNPDVYRDAGIPDPYRAYTQAYASEAQREHRRQISKKCVRFLTEIGLFSEEPSL